MKRIAAILLLVAGCKKEPPVAVVDAGPAVAAPAAGGDERFVLTPALLDAYLRYQAGARAGAGGTGPAVDRAARDEAAMKAAGLTEEQVQRIDEMISALVARRMLSQLTDAPQFQPDLEQMAGSLSPDQRKRMEEAMAAFKAQQQAAKDLTDERRRFGDASVDALLAREAEVTKVWAELMGIQGLPVPGVGGAPAEPPGAPAAPR